MTLLKTTTLEKGKKENPGLVFTLLSDSGEPVNARGDEPLPVHLAGRRDAILNPTSPSAHALCITVMSAAAASCLGVAASAHPNRRVGCSSIRHGA